MIPIYNNKKIVASLIEPLDTNVLISNPSEGETLRYDATSKIWYNSL